VAIVFDDVDGVPAKFPNVGNNHSFEVVVPYALGGECFAVHALPCFAG
jgi:hypothetical protein